MREKLAHSNQEAKELTDRITDAAHGNIHVESVIRTAQRISDFYHDTDPLIVRTAARWHDVGRLYDPDHERLSAELAAESLARQRAPKEEIRKVYDAIVNHHYSDAPQTLEGEIVRDADKLDFVSATRWKLRLRDKKYEALAHIGSLLPHLRDDFLHLEISRQIFDQLVVPFTDFIESVDDPRFADTRQKVLDTLNETMGRHGIKRNGR